MSQTTTAAIWSGRPKPSFDAVLASLPEELSPANRDEEPSFLTDDPQMMMMMTAGVGNDPSQRQEDSSSGNRSAGVVMHLIAEDGRDNHDQYRHPGSIMHPPKCDFDVNGQRRYSENKAVDLAGLCRNTFVHLDSASPLARVSQDLFQSLKTFGNSLNQQYHHPQDNADNTLDSRMDVINDDNSRIPGPTVEASRLYHSPPKDAPPMLPFHSSISDHANDHRQFSPSDPEGGGNPPRTDPSTPTPTGAFSGARGDWCCDPRAPSREEPELMDTCSPTPQLLIGVDATPPAKPVFLLDAWAREDGSASVRVENLCTWMNEKSSEGLTNLFASTVAQAVSTLPPEDSGAKRGSEQSPKVDSFDTTNNSLGLNGNVKTYRAGHPHNCKPCAFFWSKGCNNGADCAFCHQWHVPKRKKPMREQKNLMIISKEDGKIAFLRCHVQDALDGIVVAANSGSGNQNLSAAPPATAV